MLPLILRFFFAALDATRRFIRRDAKALRFYAAIIAAATR